MGDKEKLLREADEAYGELRGAIGGLEEDRIGRVWLGTSDEGHFAAEAPARAVFEGTGAQHYREHAAQIRQ